MNVSDEEETPAKKRANENLVRKLNEKKERVRKSLQDVTAGDAESPTGSRRSSGRVRNMPAKYKDFAHHFKIKEEPQDDVGFSTETEHKSARGKSTKNETVKCLSYESIVNDTDTEKEEGNASENQTKNINKKKERVEKSLQDARAGSAKSASETDREVQGAQDQLTISEKHDTPHDTGSNKDAEQLQIAASLIDETLDDSSTMKKADESLETENGPDNVESSKLLQDGAACDTGTGVETRTRSSSRIKVEKVKDEPETFIKEIFDGEMEVKKPNVFTKEQKVELVEKYKLYYRPVGDKTKSEKQNEKVQENSQEAEEKSDDKNDDGEKDESERDKSDDDDHDNKGKENQTFKKKTVKKKVTIKNNKTRKVAESEEGGASETAQWIYHCPLCNYTTKHVGFFEHHMTRVSIILYTIELYICHAPNVKCARQRPHAHFGDAPTTMHMGTNRKAQQSCGSGTDRK